MINQWANRSKLKFLLGNLGTGFLCKFLDEHGKLIEPETAVELKFLNFGRTLRLVQKYNNKQACSIANIFMQHKKFTLSVEEYRNFNLRYNFELYFDSYSHPIWSVDIDVSASTQTTKITDSRIKHIQDSYDHIELEERFTV